METGQRIRDRKDNVLLSFYTAYDYPASHIVKTRPFSYLMKNSSGEDLYASLEMILNEARRRSPVFITVSCDVGTFTLLPSDILYIAIYERGSAIYLSEKKAQELNKVKKFMETGIRNASLQAGKSWRCIMNCLRAEALFLPKRVILLIQSISSCV